MNALDLGRRRTHSVHVGRHAGGIVGEAATTFRHHADVAEDERLDLAGDLPVHVGDLGHGQDARQHDALDAERPAVEADGLGRSARFIDLQQWIGGETGEDLRRHTDYRR